MGETQRKGKRIVRKWKRKRKESLKSAVPGIIREAVEVKLHPNNMSSEEGLSPNKAQELLVYTLKKWRKTPPRRRCNPVLTRGSLQLPFKGLAFLFLLSLTLLFPLFPTFFS
jgi:hypothetical protein